MTVHIAVDIGGTQLRAACYPSDQVTPTQLDRITTQAENEAPLDRLVTLIASVIPRNERVAAIGVAAPGPINPFKGIIYTAPNIPGWNDMALSSYLEGRFGVPVLLGNDANLAALAEWQYGAAVGHHHLIYMTVSTGIGTGIIVADRLLLGVSGLAAELGHMTVLPDGPVCGCGKRGHLEAVASGTGIAHWVEAELARGVPSILSSRVKLTAKEIAFAANQGDALSIRAFARAGNFIGQALVDFLHIFNPSMIIIGGGVSRSGALLMDPLRTCMQERVISHQYLEDVTLTTSVLGDEVSLLGALALARSLNP
jgi:glucokinase